MEITTVVATMATTMGTAMVEITIMETTMAITETMWLILHHVPLHQAVQAHHT